MDEPDWGSVYLLTLCQLHRIRFWYGNRPKYVRWLAKVVKGTGHGPLLGSTPRCRTEHDEVKTRKNGSRTGGLQASSIRDQHALNFNCGNTPIKIPYSFARYNFISHTSRQIHTVWETRQQFSLLWNGATLPYCYVNRIGRFIYLSDVLNQIICAS
jgi:hypothetical protein